jgi:hypothetical protein
MVPHCFSDMHVPVMGHNSRVQSCADGPQQSVVLMYVCSVIMLPEVVVVFAGLLGGCSASSVNSVWVSAEPGI